MIDDPKLRKKAKPKNLSGTHCTLNFSDFAKFNVEEHGPDFALVFQKLAYECYNAVLRGESPDGYYWYTQDRAKAELGLKEKRFEAAVGKLEGMGILHVDRNRGVKLSNGTTTKRHHYRILFDRLTDTDALRLLYNVAKPNRDNGKAEDKHKLKPSDLLNIAAAYAKYAAEINEKLYDLNDDLPF